MRVYYTLHTHTKLKGIKLTNLRYWQLVNHGVPQGIIESVLKGISDFFDPTDVENRRVYAGKNPTGMIKWGMCSSQAGDNREHLNVVVHPQFHCPPKPPHFSEALEEYWKRLREVELGLAKAMSRALGFEECYIEKALDLKSGIDVFATNLYPPNFMSKGRMDPNEWQVQKQGSQSGGGRQQSEEDICIDTSWTVVGNICEAGSGVCGRLPPTSIPWNDLQGILGSQRFSHD
ncbi:hypothetical protein TIFTF001_040769 [Ficus carica]|uniref:Non-haem dioxygenase N-terminal domain-containing protein n=1 Tax=Ficus carica TaxID=3494 RepID=A0AA87ZDY0_FICCA|nr:hypothetical protein TIFTF001_040769 [Ficus carica]